MTTQRAMFVTIVLSMFVVPNIFGQSAASLRGTVTDQSLAVLPGATVTAVDVATAHPYVVVTDEDFDKVRIESTHSIDITDFVDLDEVDPKFFYRPYFLEPAKRRRKGVCAIAPSS